MNKKKVAIAVVIGLVALYAILLFFPQIARGASCYETCKETVGEIYTFPIGEVVELGKATFSCAASSLMYTGEVGNSFSIRSSNYRSSVNLFFRVNIESFVFRDGRRRFEMKVLNVTPELLTVEIVSYWEEIK